MKISTRTRYGMRAMLELAENYGKGPLQIKVISEHQDISAKYLEQLIFILKSSGLVNSVRGSKGGYVLAKLPEHIRLNEVFNILEGASATVECVEDKVYCTKAADCTTRLVWQQIQQAIEGVLQSQTLQDLLEISKQKKKNCGSLADGGSYDI